MESAGESTMHHHGDYESHIFVVAGGLRMEAGPGGQHVVDAQPGDFRPLPPRTVHREGNPTSDQIRSPLPAIHAVAALAITVPMFLILFATTYYLMSVPTPPAFRSR